MRAYMQRWMPLAAFIAAALVGGSAGVRPF
jgi:hypothetical protein